MNQQLPPIDQDVRAQLARRSAGRLPEGLTTQILQAVDRAPLKPRYTWRAFSPRPARDFPRTLVAGAGLAAVVLLAAALVVVPRFQTTPASGLAGYPADRALTTAELAALMAGPALPANTALVASVTIESRPDVCPMDSRPTIGVVQGMGSQVCVIGAGVSAYMPTTNAAGVFAFRYLAPGYLGLVGKVKPASSRLAFSVKDSWPVSSDAFVVEGWLGAEGLLASCVGPVQQGDVLAPYGDDCPYEDWLADDPNPVAALASVMRAMAANESMDPTTLVGNARLVQAGGMRMIDGLDAEIKAASSVTPVHGDYLVRAEMGPCPGASPVSSIGCDHWLVLAKLADISLPAATASPLASLSATSGYPTDRALTTAELGRLLDSGALEKYDTVVVDAEVTAEASGACRAPQASGLEFAGFIAGLSPQTCVYSSSASGITPGHLVLRVLDARSLGYMGTVTFTTPPTGPLAYDPTGSWPKDYGFFLVHGWLDTATWTCGSPGPGQPGASGEAGPSSGPNPLFPVFDKMCHAALTKTKFIPPDSAAYMTPISGRAPAHPVLRDPRGRQIGGRRHPICTVPSTTPSSELNRGNVSALHAAPLQRLRDAGPRGLLRPGPAGRHRSAGLAHAHVGTHPDPAALAGHADRAEPRHSDWLSLRSGPDHGRACRLAGGPFPQIRDDVHRRRHDPERSVLRRRHPVGQCIR